MDMPLVAARYIAETPLVLAPVDGRPLLDATGARRPNALLHLGDTLLLPASEVLGMTYKFDPRGEDMPELLGIGRVVKPEDAQLTDDELRVAGYEFHQGSANFEPLRVPASIVPLRPMPTPEASPLSVLGGLVVEQAAPAAEPLSAPASAPAVVPVVAPAPAEEPVDEPPAA